LQAAIHVPELQKKEIVSPLRAFRYLYQYGNAWMGVIRSDVLRSSLANEKLVNHALSTIWPQTILGLSQVQSNSESRVLLFPEVTGRRTNQKTWSQLTQPTSEYFIKSFDGLLDASISIPDIECRRTAVLSIAGTQSPVRKAHQLGIASSKQSSDFLGACMQVERKLKALEMTETQRARVVFSWIRFPIMGRKSYVFAVGFRSLIFSVVSRFRGRLNHY
jgi:hypothetical protein